MIDRAGGVGVVLANVNRAFMLALEALLDGEAEAIMRKAISQALEGDTVALRLCLERIIPPRRERAMSLDMPALATAADARRVYAAIFKATTEGELTLSEAAALGKMIEDFASVDKATSGERSYRRQLQGPMGSLMEDTDE
jgi:hypothetical protein